MRHSATKWTLSWAENVWDGFDGDKRPQKVVSMLQVEMCTSLNIRGFSGRGTSLYLLSCVMKSGKSVRA